MKLTLELTDEQLELVARRAAELVLERLEPAAPAPAVSPWVTVDAAAEFLGCSKGRIYNLRSDGRLSRHKEGGRAMVARSELEGLVQGERPLSLAERARSVA